MLGAFYSPISRLGIPENNLLMLDYERMPGMGI
jgi:hypothetical protein